MVKDRTWTGIQIRFGGQRHPEISRRIRHAVAKESGRSHADHGERVRLNRDSRANHGWVRAKVVLPRAIVEHYDRRGAIVIVSFAHEAAHRGAKAERGKVVSGNPLSAHLAGPGFAASYAEPRLTGLNGSQLLELRRRLLQVQVEVIGEDIEIAILLN